MIIIWVSRSEWWHSSFSQLGNFDNAVFSAKGNGLTNIKMYVERKVFSKGKIEL